MIKCDYEDVKSIIKSYGYDWSNLYLDGVSFENEDLTNVILPNDPELFQRIYLKTLNETRLPRGDYSKFNFNDVNMSCTYFTEDSVFSCDKDVFQKIAYKNIEWSRLPKGDYSKYNFTDVRINNCEFTSDSVFSEDKEVFQKIEDKDLSGTYLPKGDYSEYNFNGIHFAGCTFTLDSIFSNDKEVFQKIEAKYLGGVSIPTGDYRLYNFKGVNIGTSIFSEDTLLPEHENFLIELKNDYAYYYRLPINVVKNIHNYNLEGIRIDLNKEEYKGILNKKQLDIVKAKYPNAIGDYIKLPDEVFGEEESINYEF